MPNESTTYHKRNTLSAKRAVPEALTAARRAVAEALKQNPRLPAVQLAAMIESSGGEYVPALSKILRGEFYLHEIRVARAAKPKAGSAQLRLPGFEHLPPEIPGPQGKSIPLGQASYTSVRAYYRSLTSAYDKRKRNDPRVKEAKALMEIMRKRTRNDKAITVKEVVLIDG